MAGLPHGRFGNDIFAQWRHIQGTLFRWLPEELDPVTAALERLIIVLDTIGLEAFVSSPPRPGPGRKPEDRRTLARALVAKAMLGFAEFAARELPDRPHEDLVKCTLADRIAGCVAGDATEIEAREKPGKTRSPRWPGAATTIRHPDRSTAAQARASQKGEERPKAATRLERQAAQSLVEMLAELPTGCDVGSKGYSKGYRGSWTGCKLHIDVADGQIPVACLLTSASVHDSQAAIPLMTPTGQRHQLSL